MENLYYEVALPLPLRNSFTYSSNVKISNGSRVQVPFRNREIVGYVLSKQSNPNVKSIKPIIKVLDRNDVYGQYAWSIIKKTVLYAANLVPDVTENFNDIDDAIPLVVAT